MVIGRLEALARQIDRVAEESREDRKAIEGRIAHLMANGCARVIDHDEVSRLGNRIRIVEVAQAEGKGRVAIFMILFGVGLTVAANWVSKHF